MTKEEIKEWTDLIEQTLTRQTVVEIERQRSALEISGCHVALYTLSIQHRRCQIQELAHVQCSETVTFSLPP